MRVIASIDPDSDNKDCIIVNARGFKVKSYGTVVLQNAFIDDDIEGDLIRTEKYRVTVSPELSMNRAHFNTFTHKFTDKSGHHIGKAAMVVVTGKAVFYHKGW